MRTTSKKTKTKTPKKQPGKQTLTANISQSDLLNFDWLHAKPKQRTPEEINNEIEEIERLQTEAISQIDRFTKDAHEFQKPDGLLHNLFDNIEHKDFEYGISAAENIVESLISFFLIPEHSALFKDADVPTRPKDLTKFLMRLRWILQQMQNKVASAYIEREALNYYEIKKLRRTVLKYTEMNLNAANTHLTSMQFKGEYEKLKSEPERQSA